MPVSGNRRRPPVTRLDEQLLGLLVRRFGGAKHEPLLRRLLEEGALDRRRCERWMIGEAVAERVRGGAGRCEAMIQVAEIYCCSYEKVRKIVYER